MFKKHLKKIISLKFQLKDELVFSELFDKEISKNVLNHFWEIYIDKSLSSLLLCEESATELFYKIEQNCSKKITLQVLGAMKIIESDGMRTLKNVLPSHTYQRILSELAKINSDENYLYDVFIQIKRDLNAMESIEI